MHSAPLQPNRAAFMVKGAGTRNKEKRKAQRRLSANSDINPAHMELQEFSC